jgi:ABC-type transport system substrate-binding protein
MKNNFYRNVWLGFICIVLLLGVCCKKNFTGGLSSESKITLLFSGIDEYIFGPSWSLQPARFIFMPFFVQTQGREPEGKLIERWEIDGNKTTYHLHKNVRWHDGIPVTAHDVEFTVNLQSHPDVLGINPNAFDFKLIDDFSFAVTYHTNSPRGKIEYSTYGCLPRHLLKDLNLKEFFHWDFWKQPVGNGPFRYVRHVPKTMTELESNPDYFQGEPKIKHVFLKYGGNRLTELLSGEADYSEVSTMDAMRFKNDPRFNIFPEMPHSLWVLCDR